MNIADDFTLQPLTVRNSNTSSDVTAYSLNRFADQPFVDVVNHRTRTQYAHVVLVEPALRSSLVLRLLAKLAGQCDGSIATRCTDNSGCTKTKNQMVRQLSGQGLIEQLAQERAVRCHAPPRRNNDGRIVDTALGCTVTAER